jgi:hypothetical protein
VTAVAAERSADGIKVTIQNGNAAEILTLSSDGKLTLITGSRVLLSGSAKD